MSAPESGPSRLAYIDWMRGLACVLMFQTHCYDSWLSPDARQTRFFMYSQLGGTFPAPLFLFLAGISFALVTDKLWQKNLAPAQIARTTVRRGAEIFAFGLLFRLQEFVLAMGWSPWTDLLRVDILNEIGLSMILMGGLCWLVLSAMGGRETGGRETGGRETSKPESGPRKRLALVLASSAMALLISFLTPPLWTTWRPWWLPWPIESYIDGVHNLGTPQSWLFPVFPWSAFAFAGLAVGFALHSPWVRGREARIFVGLGVAGVAVVEVARWFDARPWHFYAVYDFWRTSPSFFLIRLGMLMGILSASYAWCRWGAGQWGFSPLIQLGQASLLVYWVHIEFVYGRLSILPKHRVGIRAASLGLAGIFLAMVALAALRTRMKGRGVDVGAWLRPRPAVS
ncbi:MAG TPA: heparan-alpha-glucosaminide N-acetyltransferase domain-containing protein [Candidatus Sulfotelmatobacter sp.]|nr:heparan-alpha-glucosaminide N-acetyltransferase domain-containing protein [Candidatus Sulfotelmatobacter sp.]